MNESLSIGEISSAPQKRRAKYCAAFDCNNSAYDVNGTHTSYHFFEFPKDPQRRNRWCSLIKRRHRQDDFVVSTTSVLCHEHFRAEDISEKLSGCWNLKPGLWYCRAFVVLLVCLHGNSAVCIHDLSYQKLKIQNSFWSLETRIRLIFPKSKILIVLFDHCCFIVNFMIQSVSCLVIFVTEW